MIWRGFPYFWKHPFSEDPFFRSLLNVPFCQGLLRGRTTIKTSRCKWVSLRRTPSFDISGGSCSWMNYIVETENDLTTCDLTKRTLSRKLWNMKIEPNSPIDVFLILQLIMLRYWKFCPFQCRMYSAVFRPAALVVKGRGRLPWNRRKTKRQIFSSFRGTSNQSKTWLGA